MGCDPKTLNEYLEKSHENSRLTGYGIEGTMMHVACPFCAAPGFLSYTILEAETALSKDTKCAWCGRSCRAIVENYGGGSKNIEIVQTGGPDSPPYLPKMRRA